MINKYILLFAFLCTGLLANAQTGISQIQHIFFMVQENRSLDSYFGELGRYRAQHGFTNNFDGVPSSTSSTFDLAGHLIQPYHYATACTNNLSPSWNESHYDLHPVNGIYKMDRFMKTTNSVPQGVDTTGTRAMGHYDDTDLPFYYDLATTFGTSDRFFSPMLSNTNVNRMYLFTATSFGHIRPDPPPSTGWPQPTIFDKLTAAGISWRYYYQDNSVYLASFATWHNGGSGHVYSISRYYTDIANPAQLPHVIFIERAAVTGLDEHPLNNVQTGAANTKKIIDALLASPSWATSAFILTYDEGGGLYDHVPPQPRVKPDSIPPMLQTGDQPGQFNQTGFRLPLIVLSPWSKPHFVSHVVRDYTSILKFIEVRFHLTALTARDAAADDMTEFFDFTNAFYLRPPVTQPQPGNKLCNFSYEKAPGH
jgi:phospholipase C